MPIVTLKQAQWIDGIGSKMLQIVHEIIEAKYGEYKIPQNSLSIPKNTISDFFHKKQVKKEKKSPINDLSTST